MEWIGIYFGLYVLLTIGLYHILVVKLEVIFGVALDCLSPAGVGLPVFLYCS